MQVDERFWIDEHAHVAELKDADAFPRLRVETNVIAQAGTAAALHPEAQPALLGRNALFYDSGPDPGQSFVRDLDAFGRSLRGFRSGLCFDHILLRTEKGETPVLKTTAPRLPSASPHPVSSSSRGWPRGSRLPPAPSSESSPAEAKALSRFPCS